jgi:hypothetical protein
MLMLSMTECPSCEVFLLRDPDTPRVYRLDFIKALLIRPEVANYTAGEANRAGKPDLVIGRVQRGTRHMRFSNAPVPVDSAGGSPIR